MKTIKKFFKRTICYLLGHKIKYIDRIGTIEYYVKCVRCKKTSAWRRCRYWETTQQKTNIAISQCVNHAVSKGK